MAIGDKNLVFAVDQRPAAFPVPTNNPGGLIGAGIDYIPAPFPGGYLGTVTSYDMGEAMDLLQGSHHLKAKFRVVTNFVDPNGAAANQNLARFCVIGSPVEGLNVGATVIARSGGTSGFAAGALVSGFETEIIIPKLDSLARLTGIGFRYIGLGMEFRIPVADFTAGGVNASIVLDTEQEQFGGLPKYGSGFSVETP